MLHPLIILIAIIFALGFAPGFFWLWFIYRKDKYAPEPLKLIATVFVLGIISAPVAGFLEGLAPKLFPIVAVWDKSSDPTHQLYYYTFVVGLVEEFCKLLPVWLYVYRKAEFNEVIDGVIYSSAAALGFASIENVLYITGHGATVMMGRAILSTLGHLLFASFWGLGFGLAKFNPKHSKYIVLVGFIIAVIAHGIYDVFASANYMLLTIILMFLMWRFLLYVVEKSTLLSPFKYTWSRKMQNCPHCLLPTREGSKFCSKCGKSINEGAKLSYFCGNCKKELKKDDRCCTSCGFYLVETWVKI